MKKIGILCLIIGAVLLLSPMLSTLSVGRDGQSCGESENMSENQSPEYDDAQIIPEISENSSMNASDTDVFRLYIKGEDKVVTLSALDYITGVVAAEMPASFNDEALKAQAVTSYTYACYIRSRASGDTDNAIKGADLSDQSSEYQAYSSPQSLKKLWGDDFEKYYSKVRNAVSEVIGKLIVYDDEPIMAAFHAMSWGQTEDCQNVWGGSITYLSSVDSHEDSSSDSFINTYSFTREEFCRLLSLAQGDVRLGGIERTQSGMVQTVTVNGKQFSGMYIRKVFSLASPCFTLSELDGNFVFVTKGKGHGVGLSQNGANELAEEGFSWEDIIHHYYSDVKIV